MVVTQICIDLSGKYRYEYVVAKQGDADSRLIQVTLLSDNRIYVIDDQTTARVSITKPDKTEVIQDCTVNNNMVEVVLDANMLAAAGIAAAEILLSDSAGTVTSASFDIKIVATNTGKNAESSSDYQSFRAAMAAAQNVLKNWVSYKKPEIATLSTDFTDTDKIYLYIGYEYAYVYGDWYYYDVNLEEWVDGGAYGTVVDEQIQNAVNKWIENNSIDMKKLTILDAGGNVIGTYDGSINTTLTVTGGSISYENGDEVSY